ncbi:nitroreductase family protein [soil metagenome]
MTAAIGSRTQLLRQAAVRAALAPSVHNTQPWRFVLHADRLDVFADERRRLEVLDPDQRQLLLSCGCAVFNARVSLAAAGYESVVTLLPDSAQPELLATLTLPLEATDWIGIGELDAFIEQRRSNRRRYYGEAVPAQEIHQLAHAAGAEGAALFQVTEESHRTALATLSQEAESIEVGNPAYLAELRTWTSDDPRRLDGVQAMTVPLSGEHPTSSLPVRDFDTRDMGWLPADPHSDPSQCLLLVTTTDDDRLAWLRAGQTLQRLWLDATRSGYAVSLFTQIIEVASTRERLRSALALRSYPQVLLRIGRAPSTPPSRRRDLSDVLTVIDG